MGIPKAGFENTTTFVDWVATKRSRHGHTQPPPISLTVHGQLFEGSENLARFHYRNIFWPIEDHALPGRCCPTDPLFLLARKLTLRSVVSETGFSRWDQVAAGYGSKLFHHLNHESFRVCLSCYVDGALAVCSHTLKPNRVRAAAQGELSAPQVSYCHATIT